ncbi:MAG: CDP-6-deoxy-delta-3,4-glucoseen reductase [Gammaproteobacteria bacterium]|nr:CDP-6-deoxy-delta-3,4-glucoseen reductase [Gammaproteobacteria bacterium]MBU0850268.1 CDP-6-deoxy-delta-3,4-glucoseen reductase [Gammaproteobacteria bacterium]MBU1267815.1 CDP-6-deoxy-delta-3,4-glucoseen reductase [Gammaproteobacteria bacterium]MBU1528392.1 CDP-6-deoxy-delta-3,4-glucoseen reductase [Gammaproteobacteria bacterium]MBU1780761.1 CDP-6-deoxy-delta-3,4-glucoseen reductase [Gammaproteobacteria bacterium]
MNHNVEILPSQKQFECEADDTILSAALRANVILPYGCKDGACGSCKAELLEGQVDYGTYQSRALSEEERVRGKVLTCCAKPLGPVKLKVRELSGLGDIPVKKMPCRLQSIEKPAADVAVLKLQLPANEVLQFNAGQYIEFMLRDGSRRSYSLANAPYQEGGIELHVRHMPGGVFTDHVFSTMKEREILRFEGPLGTFFLRDDSNKPVVLLASGTGFAPIKSLLEQAFFKNNTREFVLYWGARTKADLYMQELPELWALEHGNFRFFPVLSDATPQCNWQGRAGFVHRAVMEDFPDLSQYQVYACGAPIVVDSARQDFTAVCGLPEEEFFADSFTSLADAPG